MIDVILTLIGSGKSYTMMGSHDNVEAGIIPRLADALFYRIAAEKSNMACQVKRCRCYIYLIFSVTVS